MALVQRACRELELEAREEEKVSPAFAGAEAGAGRPGGAGGPEGVPGGQGDHCRWRRRHEASGGRRMPNEGFSPEPQSLNSR